MTKFTNPLVDKQQDDLDQQLNDYMGRKTLVGSMREKSNQKPELDDMTFRAEIKKYWFLYALLAVSSLFTGTLGIYMGLSPQKTVEGLYFYTDLPHLFLAIVYCIAFITVTEFAFPLAKWLYFTREEKNMTQQASMIFMMVVAGFSIFGTGIAGGMVIASNISFLTDFIEVPHQAQVWVIMAIPSLMVLYAVCISVYILSSSEAAAKRMVREKQRENDLDHATREKLIEQWGREQVQREQIKVYIGLVQAGKLTAGEAQAAITAGLTLGQTEKKLGRNLDNDPRIGNGEVEPRGNGRRMRVPAYGSEEDFIKPPQ